jgi:hypothetical protein
MQRFAFILSQHNFETKWSTQLFSVRKVLTSTSFSLLASPVQLLFKLRFSPLASPVQLLFKLHFVSADTPQRLVH